jgi:uncharacterized protein YdiU (UPF0061 family)
LQTTQIEDGALLIDPLLNVLELASADYTNFFRRLCSFDPASDESVSDMTSYLLACYHDKYKNSSSDKVIREKWQEWVTRYKHRLSDKAELITIEERTALMKKWNPKFILRNSLADLAVQDQVRKVEYVRHEGRKYAFKPQGQTEESSSHPESDVLSDLFTVLKKPFDDHEETSTKRFAPEFLQENSKGIRCSCSS